MTRNTPPIVPHRGANTLAPSILLAFAVGAGIVFALFHGEVDGVGLALVGLAVVVVLTVAWRVVRREGFNLFHPLIYGSLVFVLPNIIMKGIALSLGAPSDLLTSLTPDAVEFWHMALFAFLLGWVGLLIGYYLPIGARASRGLRLPTFLTYRLEMNPWQLVLIFAIGIGFNLILFREGAFGSSLNEFSGDLLLVSIIRPLSDWHFVVLFLFVWAMHSKSFRPIWGGLAVAGCSIAIALSLLAGSRGQLFAIVLWVTAAYSLSHRSNIPWRRIVLMLLLGLVSLALGFLVVSRYREIRSLTTSTQTVTLQETIDTMLSAVNDVGSWSTNEQSQYVSDRILERSSMIESLGVTLARADSLRLEEQAVGIDNNIRNDVLWGLIPRPLWPDKPISADFGLWFSRLYFDRSSLTWNSPTMFGDLYRNFGWPGIFLGMIPLGVWLRFLYERLILLGNSNPLAAALYYLLLLNASYGNNYSSYIVGTERTLFSLIIFMCVIYVTGGFRSYKIETTSDRWERAISANRT